jgi:hypothetical protein
MLVQFSTRNGHLIMQGEPAQALLRMGGHTGTVPGAVLAADLSAFASRLRESLQTQGEQPSPDLPARKTERSGREDDERPERPVSLKLRAVPLLEMIDTAIRRQSDLMWDRA